MGGLFSSSKEKSEVSGKNAKPQGAQTGRDAQETWSAYNSSEYRASSISSRTQPGGVSSSSDVFTKDVQLPKAGPHTVDPFSSLREHQRVLPRNDENLQRPGYRLSSPYERSQHAQPVGSRTTSPDDVQFQRSLSLHEKHAPFLPSARSDTPERSTQRSILKNGNNVRVLTEVRQASALEARQVIRPRNLSPPPILPGNRSNVSSSGNTQEGVRRVTPIKPVQTVGSSQAGVQKSSGLLLPGNRGHLAAVPPQSASRSLKRSEVIPSKQVPIINNKIPKDQFSDLRKHFCSFYEKDIRSEEEDCYYNDDEYDDDEDDSPEESGFPYRPDLTNTWFEELVERDFEDEPVGMPLSVKLKMINLQRTDDSKAILLAVGHLRTMELNNGDELHFHATDARSAQSILEFGIDLSRSKGKQDFSNGFGFYVSDNYKRSSDWGGRKGQRLHDNIGAIIAFRISKRLRQEPHLSLDTKTQQGRIEWEQVVSHFRNGETSRGVASWVSEVNYIRGPVSRNAFLRPGELPSEYGFDQICLCDDDFAFRFGSLSNISFVVFFQNN